MIITKLEASQFRNLENAEFTPEKGLNLFYGDNAQGKTSLLEAVFFLATGSSFRTARDKEMIRLGESEFLLRSQYKEKEIIHSIEAKYSLEKGKVIKIDNKKNAALAEKPRAVIFTPDDLYMLKGSPVKRRQFIDQVMVQVSGEYRNHLMNFERILKRKNDLLRREDQPATMLDAIDRVFAETAAHITLARINFMKIIDELSAGIHRRFSEAGDTISTKYALSFPLASERINLSTVETALIKQIEENRKLEVRRKTSLFGPHRDDINIYLNQRSARSYASQGQQRNIVIALKLAQLEAMNQIQGSYPVLLLDEILAELDAVKRPLILEYLDSAPYQTFLTSVEISQFDQVHGRMIKVVDGKLLL